MIKKMKSIQSVFLTEIQTSHRIQLRLTKWLMANGSLHTCSKNTITDNHDNPSYVNQF